MSSLTSSWSHTGAILGRLTLPLLALSVLPPLVWAGAPVHSNPDTIAPPTPGALHAAVDATASPTYFFEIAECRRDDKDSDDDTNDFGNLLDRHEGWRSKVDWTYKRFGELKATCDSQQHFCDVVGISEEITGGELVIRVQVYTTPLAHRSSHASPTAEHPLSCRISEMDERRCREELLKIVARNLEGLDKNHPLPPGDR